jgi:predicted DNA-binding protein
MRQKYDRTTIYLIPELKQKLQHIAVNKDTTLSIIINYGMRKIIDSMEDREGAASAPETSTKGANGSEKKENEFPSGVDVSLLKLCEDFGFDYFDLPAVRHLRPAGYSVPRRGDAT